MILASITERCSYGEATSIIDCSSRLSNESKGSTRNSENYLLTGLRHYVGNLALSFLVVMSSLALGHCFCSATGLLRRRGAPWRPSGRGSLEKFQWGQLEILVKMKAALLSRDLGNGGQSGEYVVVPDGDARDGAVSGDENSMSRVDIIFDLSRNNRILSSSAIAGLFLCIPDLSVYRSCPKGCIRQVICSTPTGESI